MRCISLDDDVSHPKDEQYKLKGVGSRHVKLSMSSLEKRNILLFHYTVCVKMQISFDPIFICCISFRNSFCLYLILTSYGFHMKPSFLFSLYSSNTNLVFSDFNPNACCFVVVVDMYSLQ